MGIWHETYRVAPGMWEAVYAGMPPTGLGKAAASVPLRGGHDRARGRLSGELAQATPPTP